MHWILYQLHHEQQVHTRRETEVLNKNGHKQETIFLTILWNERARQNEQNKQGPAVKGPLLQGILLSL